MRYLDVGVAVLVGTAAITGLSLWSPAAGDAASSRYQSTIGLRDWMVAFVNERGVPWFYANPEVTVCSAIAGATNATVALYAEVGTARCGTPPPRGAVTAQLSFRLGSRQVTLEAWSGAEA